MAGVPKNAIAVTPGGAVKDNMIAGYVTMFTIPDDPVAAQTLLRTWAALDLDTDLLPPARRMPDIFAAACRSVETSGAKHREADGSLRTIVTVDAVMETPTESVYQIGRRVVDRNERVVDHEKAMRVTFNKGDGETMTFDPLDPAHYAALAGLEDQIRAFFEKNQTKVPGYKIRAVLRAYMVMLGATNLRRKAGGVYFVPADGKGTLDDIQTALDKLYGERADLHTIPLVNDEGAREMIRKHFTINAVGQIDDLMAKINEALHGDRKRAIRSDFLGNVAEQRRAITALRDQYQGLLQTELVDLASKIEDLDDQMDKLADATQEAVAA